MSALLKLAKCVLAGDPGKEQLISFPLPTCWLPAANYIFLLFGLQFSAVVKSMLWAKPCQLSAQDLTDVLQSLCINVVLKAVPMRMDEPAAIIAMS